MKKITKKCASFVRKLPEMVQSLSEVLRHGGSSRINISVVGCGKTLEGRRILVTGGSSGIGLSIAKKCLNQGAQVVITGRNIDKLKTVTQNIDSNLIKPLVWDVANISLIDEKLKEVEILLGGEVDVLVNNAGVLLGEGFPNISEKVWDQSYQINSKGLFFLTQNICKKWLQSESCYTRKVINISSQGGFVGSLHPYRMTKWDIAGLTQGLGIKLASKGIIVNGIAPGVVVTAMQKDCQRQKDNCFYPDNPSKRFAMPEEIAELAAFLISDAANFIVGQTIVCDGGYSLK